MAISDTITSMYENVGDVYDTITNVEVNNGTNLFDKDTISQGRLYENGTLALMSGYFTSQFIKVEPNTQYTKNSPTADAFHRFAFYSSNTEASFISQSTNNTITTPSNCQYLRFCGIDTETNAMLNKGSTALPYQPYTPTPIYKNIENIPKVIRKSYLNIMNNGYQDIWDSWDKVNGSGTSVSLNNTEEAPMSLTYKGDTSQDSTTGKNLQPNELVSGTQGGITYVVNEDKSVTLNGTNTSGSAIYLRLCQNYTLSAGTYTLSNHNTNVGDNRAYFYDDGGSFTRTNISTKTFTEDTLIKPYIRIGASASLSNFTIYPMIELGSSVSEYEPYTGGIASPNPSYPQTIHTVSGDNSIEVVGKNLFSSEMEYGTINNSTGADGTASTTQIRTKYYISVEPNTTYTIWNNNNYSQYVYEYASDKSFIRYLSTNTTPPFTFTTSATTKYIRVRTVASGNENDLTTKFMLNIGSTATTYTPYQSSSYPISLGVENLWKPIPSATKNGVSLVYYQDGTYELNGTSTSATSFYVSVSYPAGTYTLSANNSQVMLGGADYIKLETSGGDKSVVFSLTNNKGTFDITGTINTLVIVLSSGKTYNHFKFKPQLEVGSVAHSFSKYGQEPIELCKIGTYQDKIDKSTGKNLFDGVFELGIIGGTNGADMANNDYIRGKNYIPVKELTNYKFSTDNQNITSVYVYEYKEDFSYNLTTNKVVQLNSYLTTNSGTKYIRFRPGYQTTDTSLHFMINEGTTALPYEPYGTDWYLKKEIGKVVLNGSEVWSYTNNSFRKLQMDINTDDRSNPNLCSNYYLGVPYSAIWGNYSYMISNTLDKYMVIKNIDYTNVTDFKTWLSTHNTTVYYVLNTPTYETITDTTLIGQLEEAKKSYEEQTNISQENNDLPFELDVVALGVM